MVFLNDFARQWSEVGQDVTSALEEVGASGYYILGPGVTTFEEHLRATCGAHHAVGVGNGLDAIAIALRAAGCQPGQRVLTTPLSAFATTLAIMQVGAVPCFVDVDGNGLLDLDHVEEALAGTSRVAFLLPVHLYGRAVDLRRLRSIGDKHGIPIIEDCAQAIGASQDGIPVGTVGLAAAFSFYPTKNLGCIGDGGALLTMDSELAERAHALRNYGQSGRYVHDHFGCNSRLDELQARIMSRAMLPRLAGWNRRRAAIAQAYCSRITNPALALPAFAFPESVWHLFPVLVQEGERDALARHLGAHGVQSAVHYPRLTTDQAALASYRTFEICGPLTRARTFAARELSLPIHPYLMDAEIDTVIDACNSWRPA